MTGRHMRVRAERGSLPVARRWVTRHARDHGLGATAVQVVELLTSELVANAVVHGAGAHGAGGLVDVRVGVEDGLFRVAVTDPGDDVPVLRTTGPEVAGGHGLRLVDRLAERWGVDVHPDGGKTVWFAVRDDVPL